MSGLPPSWMSVPRPAMLVAIVTRPGRPACATISASCSWWRAFSTRKSFMPASAILEATYSDFSIETVPTRTGCPRSCASRISPIIALYFSSCVR